MFAEKTKTQHFPLVKRIHIRRNNDWHKNMNYAKMEGGSPTEIGFLTTRSTGNHHTVSENRVPHFNTGYVDCETVACLENNYYMLLHVNSNIYHVIK